MALRTNLNTKPWKVKPRCKRSRIYDLLKGLDAVRKIFATPSAITGAATGTHSLFGTLMKKGGGGSQGNLRLLSARRLVVCRISGEI